MTTYTTTLRRTWHTWDEFVAACEATNHANGHGPTPDNGNTTWDQTLAMAKGDGYTQAALDVDELLNVISIDMEDRTQNTFEAFFDVSGSEVDMGRFLSGEPECMRQYEPIKVMRTGRVLKVVVPVNCAGAIHADTIKSRGAAIMALCEVFSRMQHTLEVWAAIVNTNSSRNRMVYLVKVQDADQPLNRGRLMFALAHPAMPRQLGYSLKASETRAPWGPSASYGSPPRTIFLDDLDINAENAIIVPDFDTAGYSTWDRNFCIKWIMEQLERIERMSA